MAQGRLSDWRRVGGLFLGLAAGATWGVLRPCLGKANFVSPDLGSKSDWAVMRFGLGSDGEADQTGSNRLEWAGIRWRRDAEIRLGSIFEWERIGNGQCMRLSSQVRMGEDRVSSHQRGACGLNSEHHHQAKRVHLVGDGVGGGRDSSRVHGLSKGGWGGGG